MLQFNQFNQATIKKEYLKDNIKYLELQYNEEETNKVYLIQIAYKRYLLQKYLGYLIPSNHKVIHLDGNIENFDIYNLGIRDENNKSPVYKGWVVVSLLPKGKNRQDKVIRIDNDKNSKVLPYHHYLYAKHLGREILKDEIFIFKDNDRTNLDISNFNLKRFSILHSKIYSEAIVRGPYVNDRKVYVRIKNKDKTENKIPYSNFLMQEYPEDKLNDIPDMEEVNNRVNQLIKDLYHTKE